jgi:hypothetical protein
VHRERASGATFVNQLIGHRPAGGFFTAHVPVAYFGVFKLFARSSSCGRAPQVVIGQKSWSAKLTACRTLDMSRFIIGRQIADDAFHFLLDGSYF